MIRLILAELARSARVWTGLFVLSAVTGAVGLLGVSLLVSSGHYSGDTRQLSASSGQMVLTFTSISVFVGLAGAANLTVAIQRRSFALWQIVGVRPSLVGLVVLAQLAIIGAAGAATGCLAAAPGLDPFFTWVQGAWTGAERIEPHVGTATWLGTIAVVAGVVLLSGLRGAARASRVAPIDALREPEPPQRGMGSIRWVVAVGALAGTVALGWRLGDASFEEQVNRGMFLIPALTGFLAALGPILFPLVLRAWTALVPARLASSWFLARHDARYRLSRSTAVIGPLMVGIALAAGFYTGTGTFGAAAGAAWTTDPEVVVLLLGGPLVVSAASAAVTVFMASGARDRAAALVQAAGGQRRTVILAAVWEALIHAITATTLGTAVTVTGAIYLARAVRIETPQIAWPAIGVVAVGGAVLLLIATVIPALSALRTPLSRVLAES